MDEHGQTPTDMDQKDQGCVFLVLDRPCLSVIVRVVRVLAPLRLPPLPRYTPPYARARPSRPPGPPRVDRGDRPRDPRPPAAAHGPGRGGGGGEAAHCGTVSRSAARGPGLSAGAPRRRGAGARSARGGAAVPGAARDVR